MQLVTALLLLQSAAVPAPHVQYTAPPFELPAGLQDSVRFGWLEVAQDHSDPASRTLRLAFTILRARTDAPAADPIVFIPGGPGMSTVEPWTVEAARSPRIALLREQRDFIIVDPRGHGLSEPHTCEELNGAAPLLDDSPAAEATLQGKLTACRARMQADGMVLATLSSVQAAHDIELLRRALGAEQINLFGASYGTRLVAEAARQFPRSIRSIVFLSPVPPGVPHLGDDAAVAPEVIATLLRRCAQLAECREAYPQLEADYDSIRARIRRAPLQVRIPVSERAPDGTMVLDESLLLEGLAQLLVARSPADGAPMLLHTLAHHGFEPVIAMAPQLIRMLTDDDVAYGTHLAFHCNDAVIARERAAWLAARCPAWVGTPHGDSVAAPLVSAIPSLIMAGELDPRTPPSYAHQLAAGLTHAQVVEIPWHGHDVQHPCMTRIQRDFIAAPERVPDVACLDSLPPIRFATAVVPSRWLSRAAMRASASMVHAAAPVVALLLLLIPFVGVPARMLRAREPRGERVAALVLWLAVVTGVTLLTAAAAAVFIGARRAVLLPAIGVPASWGWVLALPWVLLAFGIVALVLVIRRGSGVPPLLRGSAFAGVGLVLGLWGFYSAA